MNGTGSLPPVPGGRQVEIVVNGESRTAPAGSTALEVVAALGLASRPVAVEVNERVVPRRDLGGCMLADGDRLEIVTLVGGG